MCIMQDSIIKAIQSLDKEKIKKILLYKNELQNELFKTARKVRLSGVFTNKAELRSVVELSNICNQKCLYCSMGHNKNNLYTLSDDKIISIIENLVLSGRRTFLLQSGENKNQKFIDTIANCCKKAVEICSDIKIILCMGNLEKEQYIQLKEAGASRYILKFETSNAELHKYCRPLDTLENRLNCINNLIDIGYKVGSGNIIGLPGQTLDDMVDDLVLINKLKLDMVSATKFIPNKFSKFSNCKMGDIDITLNFLAILRILKPNCLIPATSSLSIEDKCGQLNGLNAGCNTLTIHDGTPEKFKKSYQIYSENRFSPEEKYCTDIALKAGLIPMQSLL